MDTMNYYNYHRVCTIIVLANIIIIQSHLCG